MAIIHKFPKKPQKTAAQIERLNKEYAAQKRVADEHEANVFFEHCAFCGDPAPKNLRLCDGRYMYVGLHHHNQEPTYVLCSAPLCEKCRETYGDKDYCPFHAQHRHEIVDFPNEGIYKDLRLKINSYSTDTTYAIDAWENPPDMIICRNINPLNM